MTRHTTQGHLTTCPKQSTNGVLTKNYSLSFHFFNLASFLFMLSSSRRSTLSVAKYGGHGCGTNTSCPLGPEITPTRSTVSATSGAGGADSWLSDGGSWATTWKSMARLGGVTSATWQPSRISSPSVEETGWRTWSPLIESLPLIFSSWTRAALRC